MPARQIQSIPRQRFRGLVAALAAIAVLCGWPAAHASVPNSACILVDSETSDRYNLWPLRDDVKNYRIETADSTFILNVCGSVVDSDPDIRDGCRKDAAGCQVVKANGKRFDMGDPANTTPQLLGPNFLQLKYDGGDTCDNGNRNRSMRILFNCDAAAGNSVPVFVSKSSKCDYLFQWNTVQACPTRDSNAPVIGPQNCDFIDTDSKKHWDLSHLARPNTDWFVVSSTTPQRFYINICRQVQDASSAEKGSGAVLETISESGAVSLQSLGKESSRTIQPQEDDRGLLYRMDGGYICRPGESLRASVNIRIFCDPSAVDAPPVFVGSDSDCQYEFAWKSKYGCPIVPPRSSCQTSLSGGKAVDLAPLRLSSANYEVTLPSDPTHNILMNMCGLVVTPQDKRCDYSAICLISTAPNSNGWRSLGSTGDFSDAGGGLTLRYVDGDFCATNRRIATTVHFSCDHTAVNSQPRLMSVSENGCDYMLEWKTDKVCTTAATAASSETGGGTAKTSGAMIFFWILFSVTVTYFGAGMAYKRWRLGYRGLDQVPHIDFWLRLWDIVRCRREPQYSIRLE